MKSSFTTINEWFILWMHKNQKNKECMVVLNTHKHIHKHNRTSSGDILFYLNKSGVNSLFLLW